MQLSRLEEFKVFASALPPQFPGMQSGYQPPPSSAQSRNSVFVTFEQVVIKDAAVLSYKELIQKYGAERAVMAIARAKAQTPTPKQIFWKHKRAIREADIEKGRALTASGIKVPHHSEADYKHVILTQLNLLLQGINPSVSQLLKTAFPNDPKRAVSIGNSRYRNRRKQAYNSDAVRNHPAEVAMQITHGRASMNGRHSAVTFGQSLGINATLFRDSDRITKLVALVHFLALQMQSTKLREALQDVGCNSSQEKVLALRRQRKGPTEIAKLLGMSLNTVKSILRRSGGSLP